MHIHVHHQKFSRDAPWGGLVVEVEWIDGISYAERVVVPVLSNPYARWGKQKLLKVTSCDFAWASNIVRLLKSA